MVTDPTTHDLLVAAIADRARHEINADIADGSVPHDVARFEDLHDFLDANDYLRPVVDEEEDNLAAAVAAVPVINAWLAAGRPATFNPYNAERVQRVEEECEHAMNFGAGGCSSRRVFAYSSPLLGAGGYVEACVAHRDSVVGFHVLREVAERAMTEVKS